MQSEKVKPEDRLPTSILSKSIKYYNEIGWKQEDFIEAVEAAKEVPMGIIGGQVMYYLPDGTCELYWLKYDSLPRQNNENWLDYCNRSAQECLEKFKALPSTSDIEKDAINSFDFLKEQKQKGVDIDKYKVFLIYFDDKETDSYDKG